MNERHQNIQAAKETLERLTERATDSEFPITETLMITPEMAEAMLGFNKEEENRTISKMRVRKYLTDMAEGRWSSLNGTSIIFSKEGLLNDGQHRLTALIASGMSFPYQVCFGPTRESRMTIDQNKVRTSGDYYRMQQIPNPNEVAAIARIVVCFDRAVNDPAIKDVAIRRRADMTKSHVYEYGLEHKDRIQKAIAAARCGDVSSLTTVTRMAAAYYLIDRNCEDKINVKAFFDGLLTGVNLGLDSPILMARKFMLGNKPKRKYAKNLNSGKRNFKQTEVTETALIGVIFRAWNCYVKGHKITTFQIRDSLPKLEG